MTTITSRPYNPAMACEACVFGRFEHAKWCSANEPFSYSFVLKSGKIVEGDELRSMLHRSADRMPDPIEIDNSAFNAAQALFYFQDVSGDQPKP